jgi:uncharacterized protein (TIGR00255 family)
MRVRSMTGYARVRKAYAGGEITLSVKSLNHRGLDLHFHTPSDCDPFENAMRAAVKKHVSRGHLDLRVTHTRGDQADSLSWNRDLAQAYVSAFQQMSAQYGLTGQQPDLNGMLRTPGMLGDSAEAEPDAAMEAVLVELTAEAVQMLNTFREREGEELVAVMLERNDAVQKAAAAVEEIRGRALPAFQARLNERLRELLNGVAVEPQRLAQEAALLADRSDIGEEIARLKIHAGQLRSILESGGEVGKKLDFLLQEMNRETNTILSKTGGVGEAGLEITDIALGVKADIEKIREQALNVE